MVAFIKRLRPVGGRRRAQHPALSAEDVERIAESVAQRLTDRLDPAQGRRFVDAATVARLLGVERDWIYAHAGELGGVRLGGPRGRLRFDLQALDDRLTPAAPAPPQRPARRATRPRRPAVPSGGGRAARSVQPPGARPVRLSRHHVESPGPHTSSGRATRQRPRPDTGRYLLDHRTAAAAGAPPAPRPAAVSFTALSATDSASALRLQIMVRGRRVRVVLHEQCGSACGCRGGWGAHLAHVELLRLRVQTWTPARGVA